MTDTLWRTLHTKSLQKIKRKNGEKNQECFCFVAGPDRNSYEYFRNGFGCLEAQKLPKSAVFCNKRSLRVCKSKTEHLQNS